MMMMMTMYRINNDLLLYGWNSPFCVHDIIDSFGLAENQILQTVFSAHAYFTILLKYLKIPVHEML